jgi:hypothetical protein
VEQEEVTIAKQWHSKHVYVAMNKHATAGSGVFYSVHTRMQPQPRQFRVLTWIVSSCYIAMTNEQIEDFMSAVVAVIYRVCKSVRVLYSYEL